MTWAQRGGGYFRAFALGSHCRAPGLVRVYSRVRVWGALDIQHQHPGAARLLTEEFRCS